MRKLLTLISLISLMLIGADRPNSTIRLTVINKSEADIAIQLRAKDQECANSKEIIKGEMYYLPVPEGSHEQPSVKVFDIQRDNYGMQLYYIQTYDPVYGFQCKTPDPNALIAQRNIRLVVLPCDFTPAPHQVGEPSMRKYLPFSVVEYGILFQRYWLTRLIY